MLSIFNANEFIALVLFSAAMTFSPGPNTMLTTAIATNEGFRRTIPFTLSVPIGWLFIMLASGLGLGALITEVPSLRLSIKLLGCFYLLWLAFKLCQRKQLDDVSTANLNMNFFKGVVIQFLNIKVWLLAITVNGSWVIYTEGQTTNNPTERLAMACAVLMFFAFTSNMTYAITGALFKEWLGTGRRLMFFNYLLAIMLIATALWTLSI
ncbi:LysE family translocator [Polynucleobacter sp. AP-Kaivos-20-H2]|uniref:LysE family translocator n=1 Tax=Polynucleobacter sp. AP-Kaivos-20-H2 TaxID=2689104 RepID=UPI001C0AE188|nr:LysE family translocator [Polynucleobacter sp. AP-Kaivos-20-H2]MBU3603493.1 LysE family translocator [Polynucleobacter sp. AP-Kaivos-20-H2]